MKFKRNEQGQVLAQLKNSSYYLVLHRINNGEYEVYIKYKNGKEHLFTKKEKKELKEYIEGINFNEKWNYR